MIRDLLLQSPVLRRRAGVAIVWPTPQMRNSPAQVEHQSTCAMLVRTTGCWDLPEVGPKGAKLEALQASA